MGLSYPWQLLPAACLILLAVGPALGQAAAPRELSAPLSRSDAWMDSVRRLPLPQQVAAVRARVLADTVLRHRQPALCFTPVSAAHRAAYDRAQQPRLLAEAARPAGQLRLFKIGTYDLADNRPTQTAAFLAHLTAQRIRRITFIAGGTPEAALYGTRGSDGIVILSSDN